MKALITFLFALTASLTYGQNLEGWIYDSNTGPLENVYIINVNSGSHAHSQIRGYFRIKDTNPGDTLFISHIGYKKLNLVLREADFNEEYFISMTSASFEINQITVQPEVDVLRQISKIDLGIQPVNSSQEVLRKVPGLIIGQHAGGGKAEQIFLRGFDIDHGTDISIGVDGIPVNMVSHAHGQGYADLHWIIPETVEDIDYGKGPYDASKGNFATAGYVNFHTKEKLEKSSIALDYGMFNTTRALGLINLLEGEDDQSAYLATEYLLTDGPVESPQNFNRLNIMGKFTTSISNTQKLSVTASHFQSKWDASGQIPQRAVDMGLISRFGSIDDTEGGSTSRSNIALEHFRFLSNSTFLKTKAFYSKYDFELFSNFTFFLEDQENGDQIRQHEDRNILGVNSTLFKEINLGSSDLDLQAGVGFRYDDINDNTLSHTANRKVTLEEIADGEVDESNLFAYVDAKWHLGKFTINPGLRVDYLKFDYINNLTTEYSSLSQSKAFLGPKLNFLYAPTSKVQFFLKSGIGFHSNDSRVVVAQGGQDILPAAIGLDLGTIFKPLDRLIVQAALWHLYLEQEFVYVGDAGIVEPSGETSRSGADLGIRYQLTKWLFLDGDINYSYARSIKDPEGENFIPLAPDLTSSGGLSFRFDSGLSGGIRYRFVDDRPANEDGSITAAGYFVTDANINFEWKNLGFSLIAENIFDVDWNETQFATESRLAFEQDPVEEIHFTPGTPFFLKARLKFMF